MTAERYSKIYSWFGGHPYAKRAAVLANRLLPAVPFVCYPALLLILAASGTPLPLLARAVLVPAFAFCSGTALRNALDRPRPYEQAGFVPLVQKSTRGKSFPSRHALSAAVLAVVWLYFYPAAGAVMAAIALAICALRVLTGLHHGRDVAVGAALGAAVGFIGMWIL